MMVGPFASVCRVFLFGRAIRRVFIRSLLHALSAVCFECRQLATAINVIVCWAYGLAAFGVHGGAAHHRYAWLH